MPGSTRLNILNFAAFQIGWFASILGAAGGHPVIGPVVVTMLVALHIALFRAPQRDLLLLSAAGLLGWLMDSTLVIGGTIGFPEVARLGGPSTTWMAFMWINFATTLHASLNWLRGRPVLASVFGFVGGPASYWAGMSFGAITFPAGAAWGLAIVALEWAVAMPLLLWIDRWIERRRRGIALAAAGTRSLLENAP